MKLEFDFPDDSMEGKMAVYGVASIIAIDEEGEERVMQGEMGDVTFIQAIGLLTATLDDIRDRMLDNFRDES